MVVISGATFFLRTTQPTQNDEVNETDEFSVFKVAFISYDTYYEKNRILFEEIIEPEINNYTEINGFDFSFNFTVIASNCGGETNELIQELKKSGTDVVIGSNCVACVAYSYMEYNDMILVSASKVQSSFSIKDDIMFEIYPPDQNTVPVTVSMIESWGITHPIIFQRGGQILDFVNERFADEWRELGHGDPVIVNVGGEHKESSNDFVKLEDEILSLVEKGVPYERISVMTTIYELADVIERAEEYPETRKVIWFGTENTGRYSQPFNSSGAKRRGMFYPTVAVPDSRKWSELKTRYIELTGEEADYVTATSYDAAWVIALTVMNTESNEPSALRDVFRDVAFSHQGVTGWIHLDENGDRMPVFYQVHGYSEDDESKTYGVWDSSSYEVTWEDETLASIGHSRVTD